MTALAAARSNQAERWKRHNFTLASGKKAYKNGMACLDTSTGKVVPGDDGSTTLVHIGKFLATVDATLAAKTVEVDLINEIEIEWWKNGSSIVAADVGSIAYILDDQTVTTTSSGNSVAGRIWAVDTTRGVAIEKLQAVPASMASVGGVPLDDGTIPAYSSNTSTVQDNPESNTIYDVPTTGAASVILLPATAEENTILYFAADGTKNAHTVQYKDATGTVSLTTALTASKRHLVIAVFFGGKWFANAYVSP